LACFRFVAPTFLTVAFQLLPAFRSHRSFDLPRRASMTLRSDVRFTGT
jgi:hypothetical protein